MPLPAFEAPADPREPKPAPWAEPAPSIQGRAGEAEEPGANSQLWGCPGLHVRSLGTWFPKVETLSLSKRHRFLITCKESDKASVFEALKGPHRRSHRMGNGEPWLTVEQGRKGITLPQEAVCGFGHDPS